MGWKHLVIEGYCFFDTDKESDNTKPICCEFAPGEVGLHCLKLSEHDQKHCPFFGWGTSKASIVLTDGKGEEVAFNSFFTNENLSAEEWTRREINWVEKWAERVRNDEDLAIKQIITLNRKRNEIWKNELLAKRFVKTLAQHELEELLSDKDARFFICRERDLIEPIPQPKIAEMWSTELSGHLADDGQIEPERYDRGYCYIAELWKMRYGRKLILLHYFH